MFDRLYPETTYKFFFIARSQFGIGDAKLWSQVQNVTLTTLRSKIFRLELV